MTSTPESTSESLLAGAHVAITGRLLSMSRDEAVRRIAAAGGRYIARPTKSTRWLVVGEFGPPLGDDGRVTRSLEAARELAMQGNDLEIVQETDFLQKLGGNLAGVPGLHRLYGMAQVARMIGVDSTAVRRWVQEEIVVPRRMIERMPFFDFPQVATLRTLARLTRAGVTPARVSKSLEQLNRWLPGAENAPWGGSAVRGLELLGTDLLLRLDDGTLADPTGQLRFDFDPKDAAPLPMSPSLQPALEQIFLAGVEAEEDGRFDDAIEIYERAAKLAPERAEISFNLGNALAAAGRRADAVTRFRTAVEHDSDYVEAWNNLGNALCDLDEHEDAIVAYRAALTIDPAYADAHFNLGETLAACGRLNEARMHWRAYLAQDSDSTWAARVRERLEELDQT